MTEVLWAADSFDSTAISAQEIADTRDTRRRSRRTRHVVDGLAERSQCAGKIVPSTTPVEARPGTTYDATAAFW